LRRCWFPLLLLLLLPVVVVAQGVCRHCKGEGRVACTKKDHDRRRACGEMAGLEHKCTVIYSTPCCRGMEVVHCEKCNDPIAEAEITEELEKRAAWVKAQRDFLEVTKIRATTVESDAFILHCSLPGWITKEARVNQTRATHLFSRRLEDTAAKWKEVVGVLPEQKQRLYLVADANQHMTMTLNKMGSGQTGPFRIQSLAGVTCTWPDQRSPRLLDKDRHMHPHIVHQGTHMLHHGSISFHVKNPAWISAGLAHWFDIAMTDITRDFCFQESVIKSNWDGADWSKKIFSDLAGGGALSFAEVVDAPSLDNLHHRGHAYAWSYCDFLIKAHPEKFKAFYRALKETNDTKKALDSVFGWSTSTFQDEWRAWALKSYGGR
jgi:hypothetical protein